MIASLLQLSIALSIPPTSLMGCSQFDAVVSRLPDCRVYVQAMMNTGLARHTGLIWSPWTVRMRGIADMGTTRHARAPLERAEVLQKYVLLVRPLPSPEMSGEPVHDAMISIRINRHGCVGLEEASGVKRSIRVLLNAWPPS